MSSPRKCSYTVRVLRRRRNCVGRRKPKPIASVIGIAIRTRVRVEVVETSPTRIPRVNVVDLPFGNFAVTAIRCDPSSMLLGIVNVPVTRPSVSTFVVPKRTGVENIHTSTCVPTLKPPILSLKTSPLVRRKLPSASSERVPPEESRPDNTAWYVPDFRTILLFSLETSTFVLTPPTSSALSPVDTSAIIGATGCPVEKSAFFSRGVVAGVVSGDAVGIAAFLTSGTIAVAGVVVVVVVVVVAEATSRETLGAIVATEAWP